MTLVPGARPDAGTIFDGNLSYGPLLHQLTNNIKRSSLVVTKRGNILAKYPAPCFILRLSLSMVRLSFRLIVT